MTDTKTNQPASNMDASEWLGSGGGLPILTVGYTGRLRKKGIFTLEVPSNFDKAAKQFFFSVCYHLASRYIVVQWRFMLEGVGLSVAQTIKHYSCGATWPFWQTFVV